MTKKTLFLLFTFIISMGMLSACSKSESNGVSDNASEITTSEKETVTTETTSATEATSSVAEIEEEPTAQIKGTITVAINGVLQNEILKQAAPLLLKDGWELQITECDDYTKPNEMVENGECDANYFEHQEYLTIYNEKNDKSLVGVRAIHYEPLGVYSLTEKSLNNLKSGTKIAIPNDIIKRARALLLLQDKRVITLREDVSLTATVSDIVDNPKNVELVEMDEAEIPGTLSKIDFGIIDGNHAIGAGFNPARDTILLEDSFSQAGQQYACLLVVKEGNENNEKVKALLKVLTSDEIKKYITNNYYGSVLPF